MDAVKRGQFEKGTGTEHLDMGYHADRILAMIQWTLMPSKKSGNRHRSLASRGENM